MTKMLIFIKYCSKFFPVSIFIMMLLLSSSFFRSFSLTDAFFGTISIVLFSLARENFTRKTGILIIVYDCILGLIFFLTTVIQVYYLIHRRVFEMNDLSLICDSGVFEFYEFIGDPAQLLALASGLAALLIFAANEYFFLRKFGTAKTGAGIKPWLLPCIGILFLIPVLLKGGLIGVRYPRQLGKEYLLGIYNAEKYARDFARGRKNAESRLKQGGFRRISPAEPVTCILVIGESATSDVMNCYGFPVRNTPFLSGEVRLEDRGKMILMKRCYALDNLTTWVFHQMLSNSDYSNQLKIDRSILIFDLCRYFGINSYMVSNQVAVGTSITNLETAADHAFFPYEHRLKNSAMLDKITPPDEIILPEFTDVLDHLTPQSSNLIMLHLFGSHYPYRNRLPAGYSTALKKGAFSMKEYEYYQTIEYTDRLLLKICQLADEKLKGPYVVCYVSDHGEDPTGKLMRGSRTLKGNLRSFFTVPCAFFLSRQFCRLYPEKISNLERNSGKPFINEHIFEALADIFGITLPVPEISVPEKNIFSAQYSQTLDGVKILNYNFPLRSFIRE